MGRCRCKPGYRGMKDAFESLLILLAIFIFYICHIIAWPIGFIWFCLSAGFDSGIESWGWIVKKGKMHFPPQDSDDENLA